MKRTIIAIVAAMTLAGCHNHDHNHEAESKDNHPGAEAPTHAGEIHFTTEQAKAAHLQTENIQPAPFRSVLRTSGNIQSLQGDEQTIVAASSGILTLTGASITEGAAVRRGETLATISAHTLQDGDPVQKARVAYETAEREVSRAQKLATQKIISAKEFDQIRMQYLTAKAAYEGLANGLTSKGVSVAAPIQGYIKNLFVANGEYVSVGQPIAMVAQNRRLQLRADVAESNFRLLRTIQDANFRTAYADSVYRLADLNGRLLSYGKAATGNASYIPVTFEFDNIGDFVPGAFAEVYLLSAPKENVLSIPVSALTEEQGLMFVYVQVTEDIYRKQEVTLGMDDGIRVEVLDGLGTGDRVVVHGAYQVKMASMSTAIPGHTHSH